MSQISPATVSRQALSEQFQVSAATGAVSWRIPLDLPPGRNGVCPEIGFEYNSLRGNDLLGIGFGLSGLQTISKKLTPGAAAGEAILTLSGIGELRQVATRTWRAAYAATACVIEQQHNGGMLARFPTGETRTFGM